METGGPSEIAAAQQLMAERAAGLGFAVALHEPAPAGALDAPGVPLGALEAADRMGRAEVLTCQPNMGLRLGPARDREPTPMINAHLDTVGGKAPEDLSDGDI